MARMSALVAQIGARLHYGAAQALDRHGLLDCLVTDLQSSSPLLERGLKSLKRYKAGIAPHKIRHRNTDGFTYKLLLKMSASHETWAHEFAAERLARHVLEVLGERDPRMIYGFDTALLPLMASDPSKVSRVYVLEQCIAPRATQIAAYRKLCATLDDRYFDKLILGAARQSAVEREEWRQADRVVCPSRFVRDSLIEDGCAAEKISVIPYGFSLREGLGVSEPRRMSHTPTALFVGGVSYRKGAHDLLSIAKALAGKVRVRAVGPIHAPEALRHELAQHVELLGAKPFQEVLRHYGTADFLVHPSYVEGSATVVFEAMVMGLPCLVTRSTGSVIVSGVSGFEYEAGDCDGFVEGFETLLAAPERYHAMSREALALSRDYTIDKYAERLAENLRSIAHEA